MLKGILVMSCIRPCVQLFMGLALCIADKSLGRNGQQIGMLMYPDDNYGYYCLCVFLTVCWCFHLLGLVFIFFLRLGLGQRRAVVIIGRWLLPSLVDTGDICCHYWQHILVKLENKITSEVLYLHASYCQWHKGDKEAQYIMDLKYLPVSLNCGALQIIPYLTTREYVLAYLR